MRDVLEGARARGPAMSTPEVDAAAELVAKVRLIAPKVADEYEAARREMVAAADAVGRAFTGAEAEACKWAFGVAMELPRVAQRWARARAEVVRCLGA